MSALVQQLEQYLRLRRLLGHDLADAARLLPRFIAYLDGPRRRVRDDRDGARWSLEPDTPAGSTVRAAG